MSTKFPSCTPLPSSRSNKVDCENVTLFLPEKNMAGGSDPVKWEQCRETLLDGPLRAIRFTTRPWGNWSSEVIVHPN